MSQFAACPGHGNFKGSGMAGTIRGHDPIGWSLAAVILEELLKLSFGVLLNGSFQQSREFSRPETQHERSGLLEASVLVHGPNDGFQGVSEDFVAVAAAARVLTASKDEMLPQLELTGQPGHGTGLYGAGAELGQQAFRLSGKLLKERLGDSKLDHGISQMLQALEVETGARVLVGFFVRQRAFLHPLLVVRDAGMGKSLAKQSALLELVAQPGLQRCGIVSHDS